jgi:hypothetical protein
VTMPTLPVVSAVEEYRSAGRLIQPVQQPEEGGLSRSAPADDGERLAPTNVEGRAGDEDFPRDAAAQALCPQQDGIGLEMSAHWAKVSSCHLQLNLRLPILGAIFCMQLNRF